MSHTESRLTRTSAATGSGAATTRTHVTTSTRRGRALVGVVVWWTRASRAVAAAFVAMASWGARTVEKILIAEFTVRPGGEARVAEMIRSLAEQVRNEPGNVLFEVHTRADDARAYWVYEIYRDEKAFRAHIAAPYGARFNAELKDLIEEDGSVLTFLTKAG